MTGGSPSCSPSYSTSNWLPDGTGRMRPKRLEIEGFTAFREVTVVDFEGANLFAFTGPTGAGKSSLVDAMGFALYGRVHRYHDKLVHAAISSGSSEVRVRFDFEVGSAQYT